jgi:pyruvate dehydrogenase E2 component (dihydrolipoamide acetyltransferase)
MARPSIRDAAAEDLMPTDVLMPQMGESIAEGTIVRWIKKVGDSIDRDEPLFEISTDKVDAEIPSPGEGVLLEIRVKEGETVPVNSVVALIGAAGEVVSGTTGTTGTSGTSGTSGTAGAGGTTRAAGTTPSPRPDGLVRSSPVVRRIAKEHQLDVSQIHGTGIAGRVTKRDIMAVVDGGHAPSAPARDDVRVEKLSVMRKKIAEHMVASVRTSPHVYSVSEVHFHRVDALREAKKAEFERAGGKLTYTVFVAKAAIEAIKQFPFANASLDGDNIIYKRDINLGIAVALDAGLIVPVIKDAARCSMLELSRALQDLAQRARAKQLKTDEVQGGTFTITNVGGAGTTYGLPIINQPQVAILGVGAVEKRAVVVDDAITIRPTCYLSLGYDHRLIDGAEGGRFLQTVKDALERFDERWF